MNILLTWFTSLIVLLALVTPAQAQCATSPPLLSILNAPTVTRGSWADLTVTVRNNNSSACPKAEFGMVSVGLPDGWMGFFIDMFSNNIAQPTPFVFLLDSGTAGSYNLRILAPSTAPYATLPYSVLLVQAGLANTATRAGLITVQPALAITTSTDKPSYKQRQSVKFAALVRGLDLPLGTMVHINIAGPSDVGIAALSGAPSSGGVFQMDWSPKDLGVYHYTAAVLLHGQVIVVTPVQAFTVTR